MSWNAPYFVALVHEATHWAWIARACSLAVSLSSIWMVANNLPNTIEHVPPTIPYVWISFMLIGLALISAAFYCPSAIAVTKVGLKMFVSTVSISLSAVMLVKIIFGITAIGGLGLQALPPDTLYVVNGLPSTGNVVGLFMLGLLGVIDYQDRRWRYWLSGMVILIGVVALIGRLLDIPAMFYYVPGVASGMVLVSACLLIASGVVYMSMARHWDTWITVYKRTTNDEARI